MRHSQFPRGLFYSLSSVHMPSFTLIGQQLPHCSLTCWKITSALSAPPSFPNYSYTKMTESVPWLCIPPLKFTAPHCPRPEVPGLSRCPDFISYADLCTLLSVLCPVPSKANIPCLSSLCSQQILSQTAAAPLPAGWGGGVGRCRGGGGVTTGQSWKQPGLAVGTGRPGPPWAQLLRALAKSRRQE